MFGCLFGHEYGAWEQNGVCKLKRVCEKCGKVEQRDDHHFTDWNYDSSGKCVQERRCTTCGKLEKKEVDHVFTEWRLLERGTCTYYRKCTHCGKREYRISCPDKDQQIKRVFQEECLVEYTCPRCGEKTIETIPHSWLNVSGNKFLFYTDCLTYRIEKNSEKYNRINSQIEQYGLKPGNNLTSEYLELMLEKNKLFDRINEDKILLKNINPDWKARICSKCLHIQPIGTIGAKPKVSIFLSYSWADNNDSYVDELEHKLIDKDAFSVMRDTHVEKYHQFSEFMDMSRKQDFFVCVISSRYFHSINCMKEIITFRKEADHKKRLRPIRIEQDIFSVASRQEIVDFWKDRLSQAEKNGSEDLKEIKQIVLDIEEIFNELYDISSPGKYEYEELYGSMIND